MDSSTFIMMSQAPYNTECFVCHKILFTSVEIDFADPRSLPEFIVINRCEHKGRLDSRKMIYVHVSCFENAAGKEYIDALSREEE